MSQQHLSAEDKILKAKQKEERRLAFEAQKKLELQNNKTNENKSKADLKKERREKQEAQRLAKEKSKSTGKENKSKNKDEVDFLKVTTKKNELFFNELPKEKDLKIENKVKPVPCTENILTKKNQFFSHIPCRENDMNELTKDLGYDGEIIHSEIIKIGLKMNQNKISDSTNRCLAILIGLKCVIQDYVQVTSKKIPRDLEQKLDNYVKFLEKCRPLCVSMKNVIRIIRSSISKLDPNINEENAKKYLSDMLQKFIHEEIECGLDGIREHGNLKINENDVILTYGNSFLIKHIFQEAVDCNKKFRVIVVDSYPRLEGKELVDFLNKIGIEVTYVLINAISYVMKEVNKVLMEAQTLLANGNIISEMGCSQIALVAKAYNVPVLICCETYKFSERVHTDSFVFNEADSAKNFLTTHHKQSSLRKFFEDFDQNSKKDESQNLNILNLYYDVTPREFISLVITEMGFLPCTAVPAIIRRNISKFQLEG